MLVLSLLVDSIQKFERHSKLEKLIFFAKLIGSLLDLRPSSMNFG